MNLGQVTLSRYQVRALIELLHNTIRLDNDDGEVLFTQQGESVIVAFSLATFEIDLDGTVTEV